MLRLRSNSLSLETSIDNGNQSPLLDGFLRKPKVCTYTHTSSVIGIGCSQEPITVMGSCYSIINVKSILSLSLSIPPSIFQYTFTGLEFYF